MPTWKTVRWNDDKTKKIIDFREAKEIVNGQRVEINNLKKEVEALKENIKYQEELSRKTGEKCSRLEKNNDELRENLKKALRDCNKITGKEKDAKQE